MKLLGGAVALVVLATAQGVPTPPLVVTAFGVRPTPYRTPRTLDGDPDLQGVWSSEDTKGIPLARPAQFGTRLYLTPEEFANRERQLQRDIEDARAAIGAGIRTRTFPQSSLIVDPPDGRLPAFTAEGVKRPAPRGGFGQGPLDSPEDFSLFERCITRGVVGSVLYGSPHQIVQGPGVVAIIYETIHEMRIISTDGRPHLGRALRQYLGDSRGWWQADELIVTTTNLTDRTTAGINGTGNRHSARMTFTERFKRVANDILQYQLTIDDPVTYERPFTISMPLTPMHGPLLPYDCHEGNMAIRQSLGGERVEDERLREDLVHGIVRSRRPIHDGLDDSGQPAAQPNAASR